MSEQHVTISHLTAAGWSEINFAEYRHADGRTLKRAENGRWYVYAAKRQPKYVGHLLRDAIEKILGNAGEGMR